MPRLPSGGGCRFCSRSLLGLGALVNYGIDGSILVRLIVALIITALGILLGTVIDARANARDDHARYA